MQQVFIDSTGYYSFLTSNDGLDHLGQLIVLASSDKFKIIFPKIIELEIYRGLLGTDQGNNKKTKKTEEIDKPLPDYFSEEEKKKIQTKVEDLKTAIQEIEDKGIKEKAIKRKTIAEKIFEEMRKKKVFIVLEDSPDLVQLAYTRWLKKFPPASTNPQKPDERLPDCLAWELILKNCDEDLIIVTYDNDWTDNADSNKLHPYLEEEWKREHRDKKLELIKTIPELLQRFGVKVSKKSIKEEKEEPFLDLMRSDKAVNETQWPPPPSGFYSGSNISGSSVNPYGTYVSSGSIIRRCTNCYNFFLGRQGIINCPYCGFLLP